jgi:hypothetical protein
MTTFLILFPAIAVDVPAGEMPVLVMRRVRYGSAFSSRMSASDAGTLERRHR